ncbi:histidine N-acetyltransferase-like [Mixophyes fleayi]|uniref:histidine N-acetyltransferase-like n=1 Tax=Mixophyes fleayi TaxID=3061075 RepID=UPI003F4DE135
MSAQIHFLPATAEDYDELMSISSGIYNGTDYLPHRYHAWLKDPRRRMFLAKSEGKVVGFESFLLVDGGVTAVLEGLRVAPWLRGRGVAGVMEKFCIDTLHSDHPEVKTIRLTRGQDPPPSMLKKYTLLNSKAVISVLLPSDQLEGALKLLECRVDNLQTSKNHCVLGPTEVLKLFEGTKIAKELLPGEILIQQFLPITTHRANLELLLEKKVVCIYSHPCGISESLASSSTLTPASDPTSTTQSPHTSDPLLSSINNSSPGFLSLGTPPYPVPLAKGMHVLDIDLFGNDPVCAKVHFLQQLKMGKQALPAMSDVICVLYADESLRAELNQLLEGLTPFNRWSNQLLLEMNI